MSQSMAYGGLTDRRNPESSSSTRGAIFDMLNDTFSTKKPIGYLETAQIYESEGESRAQFEKYKNTVISNKLRNPPPRQKYLGSAV